jgi:alpha-N-arabinofuranosidase
VKRRDFLIAATTSAGAALVGVAQKGGVSDSIIELHPREAQHVISPNIYGHFTEHLGGAIYDGVWVGRNSKIPNIDGIRKQFIDDMKSLGAPSIRWPGGCFADGYHWRDGIGKIEKRGRTYNTWANSAPPGVDQTESNEFGTHEFMRMCGLIGAEPYLSANLASGSPQEFHDWVSYCNAPAGTVSLAQERATNGHPDPFNVRLWGIGNEAWGCGGRFTPEEYAGAYNRFVSQFPRYTEPFFVAVGPSSGSTFDSNLNTGWTRRFFEATATQGRRRVHGFAMHYYTKSRPTLINSKAVDFTPAQWYEVLDYGGQIENAIEEHWKIMGEFDKEHSVKLVIDEWGTWHLKGAEIKPAYIYSQPGTLRDALHAAVTLDVFQRHADKIAMANIGQTINVLDSLFLADGSRFVRTPTFYVFQMYRPHMGAKLVPIKVTAEELSYNGFKAPGKMFGLEGSASVSGNKLTLTLVNPSLNDVRNLRVNLSGAIAREARATVLTNEDMRAANDFGAPDKVVPVPLSVELDGDRMLLRVPKQSVVAVTALLG